MVITMNFLLKPLAIATLSIAMLAPAKAETYIKTQSGHVWPKHECTSTPCVDCTFLTYEACYAKAKQAGVTDERPIGFGPGQRVPMRIDPRTGVPLALEEIPLERVINIMVGDLQRIMLYPEKGFQIYQEVPQDVIEAYERLIASGFNKHMMRD